MEVEPVRAEPVVAEPVVVDLVVAELPVVPEVVLVPRFLPVSYER